MVAVELRNEEQCQSLNNVIRNDMVLDLIMAHSLHLCIPVLNTEKSYIYKQCKKHRHSIKSNEIHDQTAHTRQ